MTNRSGGVIEATSEPINWQPPFAVPARLDVFGNPLPAELRPPTPFDELPPLVQLHAAWNALCNWLNIMRGHWTIERYALCAWIERFQEAETDAPLAKAGTTMPTVTNDTPARHIGAGPIPGPRPTGRYQQVTRRCISFNRTTHDGVAVWKMMSPKDAQTSDVFKFYDADPLWAEATKHLTYQRNEYVDFHADVTFRSDGYCVADQIVEVDMPKKDIGKQVDAMHEEALAKRPHTEFDEHMEKVECPTCHGNGNEEGNPNRACGECFGDGWIYKNKLEPPAEESKPEPTYKGHTAVPDKAIYAIPNHVRRELNLDDDKTGLHIRNIFGTDCKTFVGNNGVQKAWDLTEIYVEKVKAQQKVKDTPSGSKNGHSSEAGTTTPTSDEPAKSLPQSEAKTMGSETVDIKDKIREKYNKPQRGNDYLTVPGRVLLFRADHPDWTIDTDVIAITDNAAVFKATVKNAEGRVISSGHGRATEKGTQNLGGRFVEKAETAAIGRALAIAGYGTDDTLDDADYLSDSPVEQRKTG